MKSMKLKSCLLHLCALLLAATCVHAQAPEPVPPFHSTHAEHAAPYQRYAHYDEADFDRLNGQSPQASTRSSSACTLQKAVYGWHPYWQGTSYTAYDFSLLSTMAYFSYEVNPNTGNYSSIHSWRTTPSVTAAQAAGCRVELCATLFGGTNNTTFLTNPAARQTFIDSIISLVNFRNADGVNIDFEGIPASQRNNFTSFMQTLSTQLKAAIPGASLSMALYAVDWSNVFDIPGLNPYVDQFIIMGYDYYYSGSTTAGPSAPLYSGTTWFSYNLTRSVLYYLGQGVTRSKLLIGLPYYGNEWNTVASTLPAATTAHNGSRTYSYMRNNYGGYTKTWEPETMSSMWTWQVAGQWKQGWVDDDRALAERFDLVRHKGIGGIGIWALGYDTGYPNLWNLIEDRFSDCGTPVCADTLYDSGGPLGNYRNNENYDFTISSPAGQRIQAQFLQFNLEANWDYCYVYDGASTAAPLVGTYTGTTLPPALTSTGAHMTFRFTSDNATVATGYTLRWECVGPSYYADTIRLDHTDSALIDCGKAYHVFYDSDAGAGGNYLDNEAHRMTFCSSDPAKAVRLSFNMLTAPVQLDLRSMTTGNDYLRIWDGPTTTAPLKAVYTGSTSSYPQPGTLISSGRCLTVDFTSDALTNASGWQATLRCVNPATVNSTVTLPANGTAPFTDTGGAAANYANNQSATYTYCPDAAALAAGLSIWAVMNAVEIEQNYDYLHVYDGPNRSARLIGTFTGNDLHTNNLQTIKATLANASGCLTFEWYSDGGTTKAGWNATIRTGAPRRAYGTDACSAATLINTANQPYAGSTTLAIGRPNAEDPPLHIDLASLPQCTGANAITRLENTIWYRFSTPSTLCPTAQIDLSLENIACQNSIPGGNGAQFVLYESNACATGAAWGTPIYCSDKLLQSAPINIAGLLQPSRTYYILIDGFAGQHCNLDLILTGDITGCILPIELLAFDGSLQDAAAELVWQTDQETNNQGFYLQRGDRADGQLTFADIAYLPSTAPEGAGATYRHDDPAYRRGQVNYYRLRQLDRDGTSHFHKVLALSDQPGGLPALQVFPNPASTQLNFLLDAALAAEAPLSLHDLLGRQVLQAALAPGQTTLQLDISRLPAGTYTYTLRTPAHTYTGKWMKW